jgi:hypothetical protein
MIKYQKEMNKFRKMNNELNINFDSTLVDLVEIEKDIDNFFGTQNDLKIKYK